jgi:glycosyltransferase involved in cell wall biosynthesis
MHPPRLLLYDPNAGGHHAGYIVHVLRAWHKSNVAGHLVAAVSPSLFEEHPRLPTLPEREGWDRVSFEVMPEAPSLKGLSLVRKGWGERKLLRDLVERVRPEHVMAMYMDHTQFALATALCFSYPVSISGLLLRVSHHRMASHSLSLPQRLTRLRKRLVLQAALRNPHAGVFFSADPSVVPAVHALRPNARAAALPDPVPLPTDRTCREEVRQSYGIEVGRKVLLLFGALAERKGVLHVINALQRLPESTCREICLLLAGPVEPVLAEHLPRALDRLRASCPVQALLHDAYLRDPAIDALMKAADLILVPYLDHPGTSSVLIRAAGARRPVLCQDFGLMKEQVQAHALGQLVRSSDPLSIAAGIQQFFDDPKRGFNPERAYAFAATQTPDAFARSMLMHLGMLTPEALSSGSHSPPQ